MEALQFLYVAHIIQSTENIEGSRNLRPTTKTPQIRSLWADMYIQPQIFSTMQRKGPHTIWREEHCANVRCNQPKKLAVALHALKELHLSFDPRNTRPVTLSDDARLTRDLRVEAELEGQTKFWGGRAPLSSTTWSRAWGQQFEVD